MTIPIGGAGLLVAYPHAAADKVEPAVRRAIQKVVGQAEGSHVDALKGALADAQAKLAEVGAGQPSHKSRATHPSAQPRTEGADSGRDRRPKRQDTRKSTVYRGAAAFMAHGLGTQGRQVHVAVDDILVEHRPSLPVDLKVLLDGHRVVDAARMTVGGHPLLERPARGKNDPSEDLVLQYKERARPAPPEMALGQCRPTNRQDPGQPTTSSTTLSSTTPEVQREPAYGTTP